jgi:gluconolactonase
MAVLPHRGETVEPLAKVQKSVGTPHRQHIHVLPLVLWVAGSAHAGSVGSIDSTARYPEGPVWRDGQLYYVEYSAGDIKHWDGTHARVFWHRDGCGPSGLIAFRDHWLIACYDDNSIVEIDAIGKQVRVSRADKRGAPFVGPNDFAADGRGGVYFSASGVYDIKAPISGAVLHIAADGKVITEVANTVHYPNGLTLSRDGGHLLVAEMLAARILTFPVESDGGLGLRTVWARLRDLAPPKPLEDAYNGPDGLKLGPDGNFYIAQNGSGRVLVVGEDKKLVRTIDVPTPFVTNVACGPAGAIFVTGVFDEWKAPYAGGVYRWVPGAATTRANASARLLEDHTSRVASPDAPPPAQARLQNR